MKILFSRPLWAEIDLAAIRNNIVEIKIIAGNKRIMAVIKANAYGHGAVETARVLEEKGIDFFAVAILEEALELRRAGFTQDI
jgi:alanine racemase